MVVRHKLKREVVLYIYALANEGGRFKSTEAKFFPDLAAMDRWLDTEFQPPKYPAGSMAHHGDERYEILPDTESVPEPWQRRAALVRKVGLGCLAGGGFWLLLGLALASRGGLAILGKAGLSMAYLGGILYGATWLAGHPLSTVAIEKRVAKWADGVARTAWLRWRWRREDATLWGIEWRGLRVDAVYVGTRNADGSVRRNWHLLPWAGHGNLLPRFPRLPQAMRAAEEWLWSQAREVGR